MPTEEQKAIASINDILMELLIGLAQKEQPSKGWTHAAVRTLSTFSCRFGFKPAITDREISHWSEEL